LKSGGVEHISVIVNHLGLDVTRECDGQTDIIVANAVQHYVARPKIKDPKPLYSLTLSQRTA